MLPKSLRNGGLKLRQMLLAQGRRILFARFPAGVRLKRPNRPNFECGELIASGSPNRRLEELVLAILSPDEVT
jgi:hypothetical protein